MEKNNLLPIPVFICTRELVESGIDESGMYDTWEETYASGIKVRVTVPRMEE